MTDNITVRVTYKNINRNSNKSRRELKAFEAHIQKNDLIGPKKMICLKDFL